MKIGILTGGGDAPGLNAAIRAIVKYGRQFGDEFIGIAQGWKGLMEYLPLIPLSTLPTGDPVSGILARGGTILKSSRTNPLKRENGLNTVSVRFKAMGLDALIAIGGEDTLGVAYHAFVDAKLPVVGVPKTIDNDLAGTDTTIGFTTAYKVAAEAVDRLHSTAESHDMVHILEVMGRNTGWIALRGGVAGGADVILIPEFPLGVDEICHVIKSRGEEGKHFSIVVVAEGYPLEGRIVQNEKKDAFGHEQLGGVGYALAPLLKEKTGFEVRCTNIGYLQRGGTPDPYDRWIATQLGMKAIDLIRCRQFGRMSAIARNEVVDVELREIVGGIRKVPRELFDRMRCL